MQVKGDNMKTLIEDIEIIKKRIAHLRKLASKSGGQELESLTSEINLLKQNIADLQQKDKSQDGALQENSEVISQLQTALMEVETSIEKLQESAELLGVDYAQLQGEVNNQKTLNNQQQQTIDSHTQSIQKNYEMIDSAQLILSGVFYKVEDLKTASTAHDEAISSLQETTSSQGERLSSVESGLSGIDENVSSIQTQMEERQTEIDAISQQQVSLQQTIADHTGSIQRNYEMVNSAQLILSGVFYDVEDLKDQTEAIETNVNSVQTKNQTQDAEITSLKSRASALEGLVSSLGGGSNIINAYSAFGRGGNNAGNGYIEFKVSSNKILRVVYGIVKANGITFDKPFNEVLWALSVPCHLTQSLATQSSTILDVNTTTLSFVGSNIYCRYEVWGLINV